MLTAEQIKKKAFRSAGKGLYRSDDVDAFLEEAAEAFRQGEESAAELQKSNEELYQRVEALANALNQLRAERELIQKTMILAQRAADELTGRAQEESEAQLRDAQAESERLRRESRAEATELLSAAKAEVEKILLEAQTHAETVQARARVKADIMLEEASGKAQQELQRVLAETQAAQRECDRLRGANSRFRGGLLEAYARHVALIEQLPQEEAPVVLKQEAPVTPEPAEPAPAQEIPEESKHPEAPGDGGEVPDAPEAEEPDPDQASLFEVQKPVLDQLEELAAALESTPGEGFRFK
ncbi:MAG: DivIVA domain-containing protein [Oscillospiraceae bacterium]|jgi:cell division initiation protein|nr:DivIVA domain-containing protein [Oscillospiraceae bacterium]